MRESFFPAYSARLAAGRFFAYTRGFPKAVWLLVVATAIESTGRFMVVPYLSLYMKDAGVSLGSLGLVLGAAPFASVAFGAWGGHLADRWGRKPVQILGVVTSGMALLGFAFAGTNLYVLALLNFLNGMTRTFYRPATNAALADLAPPERRSEAYALNRIAINAAFGWGPIIGVAMFAVGPRSGFIVGGALNLIVGLFIALVIPESSAGRKKLDADTAGSKTPPAWDVIRKDHVFWIWTIGMSLTWGAYGLIQSFLPLHLGARNIPLLVYGTLLTTNAIICVFAQLPVSRLFRVSPIGVSAGASKIAFALAFLGFAFFDSTIAIILAMVVLSFGEVWGSAVQTRFVPEHVDPRLIGRYLGLSVVSELGQAFVAPLAGISMQALGGASVFIGAAVLSLAGGALLYLAGSAHDRGAAYGRSSISNTSTAFPGTAAPAPRAP